MTAPVTELPDGAAEPVGYRHNLPLSAHAVARVFDASGIQRPTGDLPRIARMFSAPGIHTVSAWRGETLVGVCRALTDHSYCCYLSDLAVDRALQGQGIGRRLIQELRDVLSEEVSLILLSAPGAMSYYPQVGFSAVDNGFIIRRAR